MIVNIVWTVFLKKIMKLDLALYLKYVLHYFRNIHGVFRDEERI